MRIFLSLIFTDIHNLGRLDYASLSQQALMEVVVENLNCKDIFCDKEGHFLDITEWDGVEINENGGVTEIVWTYGDGVFLRFGGSLELRVPPG